MSSEESSIFNYIEQEKIRSSRVPHALAIVASTVIILAGIQAASGLVGPILLALFLAVILLVPLRWLQKHGCPQFLAFLFVLICTIALFVGITYFVSQSLTEFIRTIPSYTQRVVAQYDDFKVQLEKRGFMMPELVNKVLPGRNDEPGEPIAKESKPEAAIAPVVPITPEPEPETVAEETSETTDSNGLVQQEHGDDEEAVPSEVIPAATVQDVGAWAQKVVEKDPSLIDLGPRAIAAWLARAMIYVRRMLEGGFLVLIFTIFMLFEASHFPAKVDRAFGIDGPLRIEHFHRIAEDIRRYLFLKTIANLMSGSAAMFVYWMFGVEGWLFWGIIAFFMYYIPNIGGTLAALLPGILILVSPHPITGGMTGVLLYAVCLLTIECTIAYGIEPRILGHGLRLSTLVIILSLFFWGFLLGAIGLFLAAPLTVMIKIILQAFPETRWIAIFLDGGRLDGVREKY